MKRRKQPTTFWQTAKRWLCAPFPPASEWRAAAPAFALAILSAILIRLCHQPLAWSFIGLFALTPLFWGLRKCKPLMAFWVGWTFGTATSYMWIGWLTVVARFNAFVYLGILPGSMYLGLYYAAIIALIAIVARRFPPWIALGLAMVIWSGVEFFRSIGPLGLPYGLAGHAMAGWPEFAQLASIAGVYLVSAVMTGAALTLMEVIAAFRAGFGQGEALARFGTIAAIVTGAHFYGAARIASLDAALEENGAAVRISMLQTGIDQEVKFQSYASPSREERLRLQDELFLTVLEMLDEIPANEFDLIVTPESSLTYSMADVERVVQIAEYGAVPIEEVLNRAKEINAPIIIGGLDTVYATVDGEPTENLLEGLDPSGFPLPGYETYGGLWLVRPQDTSYRQRADYRKVRLMPFGEEAPYFDLIPGFQEAIVQIGSFGKGELGAPLAIALDDGEELRFAPTICFEDQFPYIHRHYAAQGAQLFVNTTNDAWFDGSSGPAWHMRTARWRSIETGVPMIRATNSGYTVVIDHAGRILDSLPLLDRARLDTTVWAPREPTVSIYTRIGDLFGWLTMLLTFALAGWLIWRQPNEDKEL